MTSTQDRVEGDFTPPSPQDIGINYDELIDLHALIASDISLHIGMWTKPGEREPASTLPELSNRAQERQTDYHLEALGLKANEHLLDIGCGAGSPAIQIARQSGGRVTGINVSQGQLAKATERAQAANISDRVSFQYGDAMALDFADESFDAAMAIEVFAHLSDRQQGFNEAARVLRPGGHFLVSDFTLRGTPSEDLLAAYQHTWHATRPITPAKTMELAAAAGFELVKAESMTQNTIFSGEVMGLLYADRHDEIIDRYGADVVAEFDQVMPMVRTFFRDHLGSYLFLLRKPLKV
ncbi:MAG: methyltransferase domain-containing protein [Actinomycetota bacterium]|nr:methyltransferase domain-containing protein [Actinomycetota bacterium]